MPAKFSSTSETFLTCAITKKKLFLYIQCNNQLFVPMYVLLAALWKLCVSEQTMRTWHAHWFCHVIYSLTFFSFRNLFLSHVLTNCYFCYYTNFWMYQAQIFFVTVTICVPRTNKYCRLLNHAKRIKYQTGVEPAIIAIIIITPKNDHYLALYREKRRISLAKLYNTGDFSSQFCFVLCVPIHVSKIE